MLTKEMIQSIIDFTGTEYHKRLTKKEFDLIVNTLWNIYKTSKGKARNELEYCNIYGCMNFRMGETLLCKDHWQKTIIGE